LEGLSIPPTSLSVFADLSEKFWKNSRSKNPGAHSGAFLGDTVARGLFLSERSFSLPTNRPFRVQQSTRRLNSMGNSASAVGGPISGWEPPDMAAGDGLSPYFEGELFTT
jgi:hypothetical protein